MKLILHRRLGEATVRYAPLLFLLLLLLPPLLLLLLLLLLLPSRGEDGVGLTSKPRGWPCKAVPSKQAVARLRLWTRWQS
jgi:hypothetical protein